MPSFNLLGDATVSPPKSFNLLGDATVSPPKSFNLLGDAVVAPPMSFTLLGDALVLPPSAFALTGDALVVPPSFIHQIALLGDALIVAQRQHNPNPPKPKPQPPAPCPTCLPLDCADVADIDRYSLDGPTFPFVFECPAGWDCNSSMTIHMICCNHDIVVNFTPDMTIADRLELLRQKMAECQSYWENCDPTCPPYCPPVTPPPGCPPACPDCPPYCPPPPSCRSGCTLFFNRPQTCTVPCAQGGTYSYTVKAGVYVALTLQAANFYAKQAACRLARAHQICLLPIKSEMGGCAHQPFNATIQATGAIYDVNGVPVLFWIIDGDLPAGVTDSNSGSILTLSGTPTVAGTYAFTVRVTNVFSGDTQTRDYSLTIKACQTDYGDVTPDITSDTPSYWNSGDDLPAGHYQVTYVNGAMGYGKPGLWYVNGDFADPTAGHPGAGFHVNYGASQVFFPTADIPDKIIGGVHYGAALDNQAEIEAAYDSTSISFYHSGGKISMYLWDHPYGDNIHGSPDPTFNLKMV